jgi:hypothetical protein
MNKATLLKTMAVILMMGASMNAMAGLFGFGGVSWKEEVLLHDGAKIVVERWVRRGGRHEIGQKPAYQEQKIEFLNPATNKKVVWEDAQSDDIGSASFLPMLLDIVKGKPYLVANTMGCLSYNKWGRPNPPYVVFRYDGGQWTRILLAELPDEIVTPNLIQSDPDTVMEKLGKDFVTSDEIKTIVGKYRQPEYRAILREPLPEKRIIEMCGDMEQYRGHWIMRNSQPAKWRIDRLLDQKK